MGARALWIVAAIFCLSVFSGCRGCKKESGEPAETSPKAAEPGPKAAEPGRQPDQPQPPQSDKGAAAAPDAGGESKPVVKHRTVQMPDVTAEEMNDPSFPKKVTPQARRTILRLKKLQQSDPRFQRKPSGVPTPPPDDERGIDVSKKKPKKRNK